MSQTKEFTQAAAQAAEVPLDVAQDLVTNPVSTISSVPKGIWGFLNQAGQAVKEVAEGRQATAEEGNAVQNMTGFSKTKRDLAIKLGVDPYTTNEVFQKELNKVAWPAFLGKFTVNLGMAAVGGAALSAANWTTTLTDTLRDKSPTELRLMNLGLLMNKMGVSRATADAFLNNNAISPTTQTLLVAALAQLGNIPGQAHSSQAATSQDEHDALAFQQSVQLMAKLNNTTPIARITHLNGLTVCQTNDGTVIVPIQWDYAAWTPLTERFITAFKAQKFTTPASGYSVMVTGVVSPMTAQALAAGGVNATKKRSPAHFNEEKGSFMVATVHARNGQYSVAKPLDRSTILPVNLGMDEVQKRRVTLLDIAADAGVSRATASLVIRNVPSVAGTTRKRVLRSIKRLGYIYHSGAASLRTQQSSAVGLIVSDITSPFFAEASVAIEERLAAANYVTLLGNTSENRAKEDRVLKTMREFPARGILICPALEGNASGGASALAGRIPIVAFARRTSGLDYAGVDNAQGAQLAVEHLYQFGYRRIAFIGGNPNSSASQERVEGYQRALTRSGLPFDPLL